MPERSPRWVGRIVSRRSRDSAAPAATGGSVQTRRTRTTRMGGSTPDRRGSGGCGRYRQIGGPAEVDTTFRPGSGRFLLMIGVVSSPMNREGAPRQDGGPATRVGDSGITANSRLEVTCPQGDPHQVAAKQVHAWVSSSPSGSASFWSHLEKVGFSVSSTPRAPSSSPPVKTPEAIRVGEHFADRVLKDAHRRSLIQGDPKTLSYWARPGAG